MKKIGTYLIIKGLQWFTALKKADLAGITKKIIEVAKSDKKGHEKAEEVILYANEKYISKSYQWVTRLVVEILYVVAEEKGLLKRDVVKKSN